MTQQEMTQAFIEAMKEWSNAQDCPKSCPKPHPHRHMEFSKILMALVSILYALTWLIGVIWLRFGDMPVEIFRYMSVMYGVCIFSYCCKSGYENREKIKAGPEIWQEGCDK